MEPMVIKDEEEEYLSVKFPFLDKIIRLNYGFYMVGDLSFYSFNFVPPKRKPYKGVQMGYWSVDQIVKHMAKT